MVKISAARVKLQTPWIVLFPILTSLGVFTPILETSAEELIVKLFSHQNHCIYGRFKKMDKHLTYRCLTHFLLQVDEVAALLFWCDGGENEDRWKAVLRSVTMLQWLHFYIFYFSLFFRLSAD